MIKHLNNTIWFDYIQIHMAKNALISPILMTLPYEQLAKP